MRTILLLGAVSWAAAAAVPVSAADPLTARVLADRVNLRARPEAQAEVVVQVSQGDTLQVKSASDEWVEVAAPDNAPFWVHRDMASNNVVSANKVNVRSGPGINHTVVGTLARGDPVTAQETFGEWMRIAPKPAFSLWISRTYVDMAAPPPRLPEAPPAVAAGGTPAPAPADAPAAGGGPPHVATAVASNAAATSPVVPPPADLKLIPLDGQGRVVTVAGMVKPAEYVLGAPAAHRLVQPGGPPWITVCHLRGNRGQLDGFFHRQIRVKGREYWVSGASRPVIVVEAIEVDAR